MKEPAMITARRTPGVERLARGSSPDDLPRAGPAGFPGGSIIHRKASCACGGGCPACQAKSGDLKVSHPNDPAEIEADRMADRVMRMPETAGARGTESGGDFKISRSSSPGRAHSHDSSSLVGGVMGSTGEPLSAGTRRFMESRFGYDFGHVRVHNDEKAAVSADAVNALAYTVGQNVVFGRGQFAPDTHAGRRLLAHELTHVVQQDRNMVRPQIQRDEKPKAGAAAAVCDLKDVFTELDPGAVLPSAYFRNGEGIFETKTTSAKDEFKAALEKSKKGNCVTKANFPSISLKWDLGNPKMGRWYIVNLNKDSTSFDINNQLIYSRKPCCECFSGSLSWSMDVSGTRIFDKGKPTERKESGKTAAPLTGKKQSEKKCTGAECCSVNKTFPISTWMGDAEVSLDFKGTMTLAGSIFPAAD